MVIQKERLSNTAGKIAFNSHGYQFPALAKSGEPQSLYSTTRVAHQTVRFKRTPLAIDASRPGGWVCVRVYECAEGGRYIYSIRHLVGEINPVPYA